MGDVAVVVEAQVCKSHGMRAKRISKPVGGDGLFIYCRVKIHQRWKRPSVAVAFHLSSTNKCVCGQGRALSVDQRANHR